MLFYFSDSRCFSVKRILQKCKRNRYIYSTEYSLLNISKIYEK